MDYKTDANGRNLTVRFYGEIDEHCAADVRRRLDEMLDGSNAATVIFNMSGVTFVDSTGLGFILGRYKKLRKRGAELCVTGVCPQVDKVFRASGVYSVCPKV